MWPFPSKPKSKPMRRRLTGETVANLVREALLEDAATNLRVLMQKDEMACVELAELHAIAKKCAMPWRKDVWECEDIARNHVNEAQKIAANEGCSWAIGTVRARPPGWADMQVKPDALHVYVWFVTLAGRVCFYDSTALKAAHEDDLIEADYAIT
jgi:hypothetical protein